MSEALIKAGDIAYVGFDDWFTAPDGGQYQGAYGPVTILKAEDLLGFKPKGSADWFAQVGYGDKAVLLAGCRIHTASPSKSMRPTPGKVYDAR